MAFIGLHDGGLSLKLGCTSSWTGGTEVLPSAHAMEFETTDLGIAGMSFWMEVDYPFDVARTYPSLRHGSRVALTHTYDSQTTGLYRGFVLNDPRVAYAGDRAVVSVLCGGPGEVARFRSDTGFVFTERDTEQWFPNKRNGKWVSVDNSDGLYIGVTDGTHVPYGPGLGERCGVVGYLMYAGADYLIDSAQLYGVKRIRGRVRWNLQDDMDAKLGFADSYKLSRDKDDYGLIHAWTADSKHSDWVEFDTGVAGAWHWDAPAAGAVYLTLMLWTTHKGGITVTDDRFVEFDNLEMYCVSGENEYRIDEGMTAVADFIGLHNTVDTANVASLEQSLVSRPMTNPVSTLQAFALQADKVVTWGWWPTSTGIVWRCRPALTQLGTKVAPASGTIRYQSNCFVVDASDPEVTWDVTRRMDNGEPRVVRLGYGKTAKSNYPPGFPKTVVAPKHPGFSTGNPFVGSTCPVLYVDFTQHNFSDKKANNVASNLAKRLGMVTPSGSCSITKDTVDIYTGGTWPVPYIRGGDWIECINTQDLTEPGPLPVTRSHVQVETGYVDLEVGLSSDGLLEQFLSVGSTRTISYAKKVKSKKKVQGPPKKKKKRGQPDE